MLACQIFFRGMACKPTCIGESKEDGNERDHFEQRCDESESMGCKYARSGL